MSRSLGSLEALPVLVIGAILAGSTVSAQRATSAPQRATPAPGLSLDASGLQDFKFAKQQAMARRPASKPTDQERKAQFESARTRILQEYRNRLSNENLKISARFQSKPQFYAPIAPTPDPCQAPKITAIDAYGALQAGSELIVNGCGFGSKHPDSKLHLLGNFPPTGKMVLDILGWYGHTIHARVPVLISETGNSQEASLQVVRKDLKLSNQWEIAYQPWIVEVLPASAVKVYCGKTGPQHNCAKAAGLTGDPFALLSPWVATAAATHGDDPVGVSTYSTDKVAGTLKNGWLLAGFAWWWWYEAGNDGLVMEPTGFQSWVPTLSMNVLAGSLYPTVVAYKVDVYAMGPKGLSPY
jgi:hypothetical protein